jgi:hypothetical protein
MPYKNVVLALGVSDDEATIETWCSAAGHYGGAGCSMGGAGDGGMA